MFTLYGALSAVSLAAMLAIACTVLRKKGVDYGSFIRFAVVCIPLAFLGSRVAFCLSNLSYYLETISMPEMMLHVTDGGASMTGALCGILLAAPIAARWAKVPAGTLLDAAALGMPAALVIERLAEPLCEMGWGKYFQSTTFDWMYDLTLGMHPVFAYEVLAAVIIGAAMVLYFRKHPPMKNDAIGFFLVLYGCSQALLESLRNDGHMKVIHFVRVNQVAAIVMAAAVLVLWSLRCVKAGCRREAIVTWLTTVASIGFGVVQEFAADGDENPYFSYTLVAGLLAALVAIAGAAWYLTWRMHGKSAAALPGAALLAALLLVIERTVDTGCHRLFFVYGIMALNLYIIGHMAFALHRLAATEQRARVIDKYGLQPPVNK